MSRLVKSLVIYLLHIGYIEWVYCYAGSLSFQLRWPHPFWAPCLTL